MAQWHNYSKRSPAVRRIMQEAKELSDPTGLYHAQPTEDNIFEWHFTIRGPEGTVFEEGIYHGRILLPTDYPYEPPAIILLTPNGRFETHKKICLSVTQYHRESWQPAWGIRTVLLALIAFLPTEGRGAIGSLDLSEDDRKTLAAKSGAWKCEKCGERNDALVNDRGADDPQASANEKDQEAVKAMSAGFQAEEAVKGNSSAKEDDKDGGADSPGRKEETTGSEAATAAGVQGSSTAQTVQATSSSETATTVEGPPGTGEPPAPAAEQVGTTETITAATDSSTGPSSTTGGAAVASPLTPQERLDAVQPYMVDESGKTTLDMGVACTLVLLLALLVRRTIIEELE
eukprot:Clim_evm5s220 gene=Clim_evmTU5s220